MHTFIYYLSLLPSPFFPPSLPPSLSPSLPPSLVFLDLPPRHWSADGSEVDLVGGPQHSNQVSAITRTPNPAALQSIGLDKTVRTIQASTNELR